MFRSRILASVIWGAAVAIAAAQTPVGTEIQYQGRLRVNGQNANGTFDFRFRLMTAETGGAQIGSAKFVNDLVVADGLFSTPVDTGGAPFQPDARWIELAVRNGASSGAYTTLSPRQRIYATPVAMYSLNDLNWKINGDDIQNTNSDKVGIGEATPLAKLHVTGGVDLGANFDAADLSDEKLLIEAADAWMGLYSNSGDNVGSGLTFGEFNTTTFALNKWAMYRRASTGNNDLVFTYGTNPNPTANTKIMQLYPNGNVGIGVNPQARLHVYQENREFSIPSMLRLESRQTPSVFDFHYAMEFSGTTINCFDEANNTGEALHLNYSSNGDVTLAWGGGNVGVGTPFPMRQFHVEAGSLIGFESTDIDSDDVIVEDANAWLGIYSDNAGGAGSGIVLGEVNPAGGVDKWAIYRRTNSNVGDLVITHGSNPNPTANEVMFQVLPDGTTKVQILEITGADVAERFPCSESVEPGSVVMIDADNPGQLCLAKGAYNRKVAGIVSGAGDIPVGAILGNLPGKENAPAIALSGRVWVRCDARERAVEPGDLLTTSDRAGFAMKVEDHARASGATIGKAMTALAKGDTGMVLVLVNLQ